MLFTLFDRFLPPFTVVPTVHAVTWAEVLHRKKPRITESRELVEEQLVSIRASRRASHLSSDEHLMLLHVYFSIAYSVSEQIHDEGRNPVNALDHTAALTRRGRRTIARTVKTWTDSVQNRSETVRIEARNRGNTQPKQKRMYDSPEILSAVRNFVMTNRVDREVCTAREVLRFCIENQPIHVNRDDAGYMVQK